MRIFWNRAVLSAALLTIALAPAVLRADDHKEEEARRYHDKSHNDDHQWNRQEDQAYRVYAKEKHRSENEFSRLKERDQQNYWRWRHDHSDTLLKIEIH
jgi:hypothetical protein